MEEAGWRQPGRVNCPNCGASSPAGAVHCSACGSLLPASDQPDDETVIDVSGDQPRVLDEEQPAGPFWQGGFTTIRLDQRGVTVSRGGRRGCLIIALLALLLVCCVCWVFWMAIGSIF